MRRSEGIPATDTELTERRGIIRLFPALISNRFWGAMNMYGNYGNYGDKGDYGNIGNNTGYGNENRAYTGFVYPQPEAAESASENQPVPGEDHRAAPAGAPAERLDAPVPDKASRAARKPSIHSIESNFAPRTQEWREPIYSQTHETVSTMYTPGIYANQPYYRKRDAEEAQGRKARESSGRSGGFLRMACLVLVCVILSGAVTYGVMEYRFNRGDFTVVNPVVIGGSKDEQQSSGLSAPVYAAGAGMSAEDIYIMACTQVVSISTMAESISGMFGGSVPNTTAAVVGSGFIISVDGYILTNYHVVETAYQYKLPLTVCLNDGAEYDAQIIGYESSNDVALIKIEADGLNPVVISDSDSINVGQAVYAVGNPFGELVYTMTEGIVSARDREVSVEGKIINTFQFSAAVNSGNSGGPVYDTYGEVIGIVTAKPMSSSVEGIGFAIPINDAVGIAAELIEHGYITGKPLMGITADTVSRAHAEYYGWGVVGVYVISVSQDSAAEKAGMLVGDIIIGLGGTEIDSMETLRFAMRKYKAGETAGVTVWRGGESIELSITFDEDLSAGQVRSPQPDTQDNDIPSQTHPTQKPSEKPEEWPAESPGDQSEPTPTLKPTQEPEAQLIPAP